MEIFDGGSVESKKIGKFCGSDTPTIPFLSENETLLHFESPDDFLSKHLGFKIEYQLSSKLHF